MQRGMNMRDMKKRQMGLQDYNSIGGKGPGRETVPDEGEPESEPDGDFAEGVLVDRGDGVLVKRGRHAPRDDYEDDYDLPIEAPPGWLGGYD